MISKFGYKGTAFLQYRRENHDIPFYLTYSFFKDYRVNDYK